MVLEMLPIYSKRSVKTIWREKCDNTGYKWGNTYQKYVLAFQLKTHSQPVLTEIEYNDTAEATGCE